MSIVSPAILVTIRGVGDFVHVDQQPNPVCGFSAERLLAATVAHVGGDTVNEHILSIDSEYLFDTLFLPCV